MTHIDHLQAEVLRLARKITNYDLGNDFVPAVNALANEARRAQERCEQLEAEVVRLRVGTLQAANALLAVYRGVEVPDDDTRPLAPGWDVPR